MVEILNMKDINKVQIFRENYFLSVFQDIHVSIFVCYGAYVGPGIESYVLGMLLVLLVLS